MSESTIVNIKVDNNTGEFTSVMLTEEGEEVAEIVAYSLAEVLIGTLHAYKEVLEKIIGMKGAEA